MECREFYRYFPKAYSCLFISLLIVVTEYACTQSPVVLDQAESRQFIATPALSPIINALHYTDDRHSKSRPTNEPQIIVQKRKPPRKLYNRQCEFFTKDICLHDPNYPYEKIRKNLGLNRKLVSAMYAEGIVDSRGLVDGVDPHQELAYTHSHYYGTRRSDIDGKNHRDYSKEGGFICPSEVKYARPQRAKNQDGIWMTVVNTDEMPQTIRMEKCRKPEQPCSYISDHFISQCSQVYTLQRLMVFDEHRGVHIDVFRVPSCCSCHIKGYAVKFPQLTAAGSVIVESSSKVVDNYGNEDFLGNAMPEGSSFHLPPDRPINNLQSALDYEQGSTAFGETSRSPNNFESNFNFESEKMNNNYQPNNQYVHPKEPGQIPSSYEHITKPGISQINVQHLQEMIKYNQQQLQKPLQNPLSKPHTGQQSYPQQHASTLLVNSQTPLKSNSQQLIKPQTAKQPQFHQKPYNTYAPAKPASQKFQNHQSGIKPNHQKFPSTRPHEVHRRPERNKYKRPQGNKYKRPQMQKGVRKKPLRKINNRLRYPRRPAGTAQKKRRPKHPKRPRKKAKRNSRRRPPPRRQRRPFTRGTSPQRKLILQFPNSMNERFHLFGGQSPSLFGMRRRSNFQSRNPAIHQTLNPTLAASTISVVRNNSSYYDQKTYEDKIVPRPKDNKRVMSITFSPPFTKGPVPDISGKGLNLIPNNSHKQEVVAKTTMKPKEVSNYGEDFKPLTYPSHRQKVTEKTFVDGGSVEKLRSTTAIPPSSTTKKPIPYITPDVDPRDPNKYNYGYHPIIDYMLNNET